MWSLTNRTVYAAERNWIRDKAGDHHWIVAVRATFDIAPSGKLTLADDQPPPSLGPEYHGDPGNSSVRLDSDLLGVKPGTDLVLDACAHAPRGRLAAEVAVSLQVGGYAKNLIVFGPRVYYKGLSGLTTSAPRPFASHPIRYEWAFGGADLTAPDPKRHRIDSRNPIGKGFTVNPDRLVHEVAHAVEFASGKATSAGPAGFGPVDRAWLPRSARAGTYDDRWTKSKSPLLPDDYDDRFASSAPDDQYAVKPLRGGETVTVVNMTREGALRFDLPKIFLAFNSRFPGGSEEHRATLATVFVALEEMKLSMIWQSSLRVPANAVDYLDVTTISEKRYIT